MVYTTRRRRRTIKWRSFSGREDETGKEGLKWSCGGWKREKKDEEMEKLGYRSQSGKGKEGLKWNCRGRKGRRGRESGEAEVKIKGKKKG